MAKTSLHAFKANDVRIVADWLKSKGLHKLCSVFEGIQEPFPLSLACKSGVSRSIEPGLHTQLPEHNKSFRNGFPGVGAFDHLEWTYDGAFEQKFSKNSNARGVSRGVARGGC